MSPATGSRGTRDIRVLVVDDHEAVREGLASALEKASGVELVGEAENGRIGIEMAMALVPDVILMDINMPDTDGIEATRIICAASPQIKIIGFSLDGGSPAVTAMLEAGASAHISKDSSIKEVLTAIRKHDGKRPE